MKSMYGLYELGRHLICQGFRLSAAGSLNPVFSYIRHVGPLRFSKRPKHVAIQICDNMNRGIPVMG